MRILIVGGGGFVGAWTARRLLDDGMAVRVFDLNPPNAFFTAINDSNAIEWITGDVVDTEGVIAAAQGCDAIVHMAGVLTPFCREDPIRGAMINVLGTLNAFEAARAADIGRVVYTSSGGVYGPPDVAEPWPTTHYGAFKLANEGSARAYWADHSISSLGLRPFVVYGPGRETGLTAGPTLACKTAARGEPFEIPYSGRSGMIYVSDVVEALWRGVTAEFDGAHVVNLAGEDVGMEDIVSRINGLAGAELISFDGPPMPSPSTAIGYDGSGSIGPIPVTGLDEGLSKTFAFYRAARSAGPVGER